MGLVERNVLQDKTKAILNELDRESVGRDMHRKAFQVAKRNEFQNIIFCDGFLIGFCFLTQNLFLSAKFLLMKISEPMGGGIFKFFKTSWEKH